MLLQHCRPVRDIHG